MGVERVTRFAYSLSNPAKVAPTFHSLRDGDAFIELLPQLLSPGIRFGGILMNLQTNGKLDQSKKYLLGLGEGDLLVVTTRPPLDDSGKEARRRLWPCGSYLETKILRALGRYFDFCNRAHTRLAPALARLLPPELNNREEITYYQYNRKNQPQPNASYRSLKALRGFAERPEGLPRTAVFLVRTQLAQNGPWVLNAFGMSGDVALIWGHLLRTRRPDLLNGTGPLFYMGELTMGEGRIPERPFTLAFSENWSLQTVLETTLVPPAVIRKRGA